MQSAYQWEDALKKSTIIATCLVNLRSGIDLEHGEMIVLRTFEQQHPKVSFHAWNTEVHDHVANQIIRNVGNPMWVNVENFIRDLW